MTTHYDTPAAARRMGVSTARVRELILEGRLPAKKLVEGRAAEALGAAGAKWVIAEEDLERFMAVPRPKGRPRKRPDAR